MCMNRKLRTIVVEDERLPRLTLLQKLEALSDKVEVVDDCDSYEAALASITTRRPDLVLLDIQLRGRDSIQLLNELQQQMTLPYVIFTTAYDNPNFLLNAIKLQAVDYLLKPFGLQDFQRAANRLKERLESSAASGTVVGGSLTVGQSVALQSAADTNDDTIFLKTEYRVVKVSISDIRYVEAMSEYLKVYLDSDTKPIVTLLSMKKMEERLPANFMRIHRSYIINLTKIQEVNKNRVIMDADTYLPIGDMYKDTFQAYLDTKFLGK